MTKEAGRIVPLSPFRRLVTDLMLMSRNVPAVTVDRHMIRSLGRGTANMQPRLGGPCSPRRLPWWRRHIRELRRSYMSFPWARLYEHPYSTVALNVERELPEEMVVATQCLVHQPHKRSLTELDGIVRSFQSELWRRRSSAGIGAPWPSAGCPGRCVCRSGGPR